MLLIYVHNEDIGINEIILKVSNPNPQSGTLPVERVECYDVPDGLDDLLCHCLDLLRRLKVVMLHILCERHQHWLLLWAFFVLATPKRLNQN